MAPLDDRLPGGQQRGQATGQDTDLSEERDQLQDSGRGRAQRWLTSTWRKVCHTDSVKGASHLRAVVAFGSARDGDGLLALQAQQGVAGVAKVL